MVTKHDVEQEALRLHDAVARAVAAPEHARLAAISDILRTAAASVELIVANKHITLTAEQRQRYFPPRPRDFAPADPRVADEQWRQAEDRGRRYRDEALARVGPLLTPSRTSARLGVSAVTVNKWRRQDKLLGIRFDDHQYLYPVFQFADSPLEGERGVLRYLDVVLHALGERTGWEKALFLLAPQPALHGQRPIDALRVGDASAKIDRLIELAHYAGEMGH